MKECTYEFIQEIGDFLYMNFKKLSDYSLHVLDSDKEVLALSYLEGTGLANQLYSIQTIYGDISVNPTEFDYTYLMKIEDGTIIKLPTENSNVPKGYKYEKELLK